MSKHGKTHLSAHPEVDYAIVLDGGDVAVYFRNTTRKLMPNRDAFEALFGKLEEYKPGKAIPHRPKTAFPIDVSISDQAYALLVQEAAAAAAAVAPVKPREDETPTPPEGTPTPPDKPPTKPEKDDDDRHGKGRRKGLELDDK